MISEYFEPFLFPLIINREVENAQIIRKFPKLVRDGKFEGFEKTTKKITQGVVVDDAKALSFRQYYFGGPWG